MAEFKYQIGGKTYIQKPLVLGQVKQLNALLDGMVIPKDISVSGLIKLLGDKLPLALAIVLTEKGKHPKDKDIEALAKELEFEIDADTTSKVVEDFFDCNQIVSLIERIQGVINKARSQREIIQK